MLRPATTRARYAPASTSASEPGQQRAGRPRPWTRRAERCDAGQRAAAQLACVVHHGHRRTAQPPAVAARAVPVRRLFQRAARLRGPGRSCNERVGAGAGRRGAGQVLLHTRARRDATRGPPSGAAPRLECVRVAQLRRRVSPSDRLDAVGACGAGRAPTLGQHSLDATRTRTLPAQRSFAPRKLRHGARESRPVPREGAVVRRARAQGAGRVTSLRRRRLRRKRARGPPRSAGRRSQRPRVSVAACLPTALSGDASSTRPPARRRRRVQWCPPAACLRIAAPARGATRPCACA